MTCVDCGRPRLRFRSIRCIPCSEAWKRTYWRRHHPLICRDCGGERRFKSSRCGPCYRKHRAARQREATRTYRAKHADQVRAQRQARTARDAQARIARFGVRKPGPKPKVILESVA